MNSGRYFLSSFTCKLEQCDRKRLAVFLTVLISWLCVPATSFAQTGSGVTRQKDAQGIGMLQASLARMGTSSSSAQQMTSLTTGNVLLGDKQFPVMIKTSGTGLVRVEIQKPSGLAVYILNNGSGQIHEPDGKIKYLSQNNTLAQRVSHIPALSLLGDIDQSQVEVGPPIWANANGAQVASVKLDIVPDTATKREADDFRRITANIFQINPATNLVSEVDFTQFNENSPGIGLPAKIVYSDYRNVNGIMVPFRQESYFDGQLESTLILDSVQFNVPVDPSEFALVEEVSNGR